MRPSSIQSDGSRVKIRIADVAGRFQIRKKILFAVLILVYAVLPWMNIGGRPVILIDILHRQFYLFGATYNAQDFYLVFFLVSGVLFTLFYLTALAGRVWCGYACPQTVFLEGVYRAIERLIEGPRSQQILLSRMPWNAKRVGKFFLKHAAYLFVSLVIAHVFLSYFVSLKHLFSWMGGSPAQHWVAFSWVMAMTLAMYLNFAWFREQLCLIVCPYGRIQSALIDEDTLIIGYDVSRGEPRGKLKDEARGDCINCRRCVDVCPTGIDIRTGLQLECVGCANCVDACDEVMRKIGQKPGLIRYDSLNGLEGRKKRVLRPRIYFYTLLFMIGMLVFSYFLSQRNSFEANVLRLAGVPYQMAAGKIRNQFKIHLFNKNATIEDYDIVFPEIRSVQFIAPVKTVRLEGMGHRQVPFFVETDASAFKGDFEMELRVRRASTGEEKSQTTVFMGPKTR